MLSQRKSVDLMNSEIKITLTSNGSDSTDCSESNIKHKNRSSKNVIKDLKEISFKKSKYVNKYDEETNTEASPDIETRANTNSMKTIDLMVQDDHSVHSYVISEYGRDIIRNMKISETKMTGNLDKHEIKSTHRKQMVVWIDVVFTILKSPVETFFLAVNIMDRYIEKSKERLMVSDLHEIGMTSMFIASKYNEINSLTLDYVINKIGHWKITERKLLKRERGKS